MVKQENLVKQATLSLLKRARLATTILGREVKVHELRQLYKEAGVTKKKIMAKKNFRCEYDQKKLDKDTKIFAELKKQVLKSQKD